MQQHPENTPPQESNGQPPELPVEICPVCSMRLESLRCKFVCSRCGYFMSCSEFD